MAFLLPTAAGTISARYLHKCMGRDPDGNVEADRSVAERFFRPLSGWGFADQKLLPFSGMTSCTPVTRTFKLIDGWVVVASIVVIASGLRGKSKVTFSRARTSRGPRNGEATVRSSLPSFNCADKLNTLTR